MRRARVGGAPCARERRDDAGFGARVDGSRVEARAFVYYFRNPYVVIVNTIHTTHTYLEIHTGIKIPTQIPGRRTDVFFWRIVRVMRFSGVLVVAIVARAVVASARDDIDIFASNGAIGLRDSRDGTDGEACRMDALWKSLKTSFEVRASASEACAALGASADARCVVASVSTACRLRRARARGRTARCGRDGEDCERCVLRAVGSSSARSAKDELESDADDDEVLVTVDKAVEFAIYVDETRAIDRDCKHYIAMRRAELAEEALEAVTTRLVLAHREANERAETLAVTLRDVDASTRRNAIDARAAATAIEDVRARQRAFADDFNKFVLGVDEALKRVERASTGALQAIKFVAELAKRSFVACSEVFSSLVSLETIVVRCVVVALAFTSSRFRGRAIATLAISWTLRALALSSTARLRVGLLIGAVAPSIRVVAAARGAKHRASKASPTTTKSPRHRPSTAAPRRTSSRVRARAVR